mmetsp:Transcript_20145/g.49414  ORF Transcript_20145/g.49414 Transcript_20145/m.49414 type:complete len:95 (-) Transcript_20145:99-383(-)
MSDAVSRARIALSSERPWCSSWQTNMSEFFLGTPMLPGPWRFGYLHPTRRACSVAAILKMIVYGVALESTAFIVYWKNGGVHDHSRLLEETRQS